MFIVTAKVPRRKLALCGLAAAALICCVVSVRIGTQQPVLGVGSASVSTKGVKTNEDRLNFLSGYGWQVEREPLAVEEMLIPEEFDDSYHDYLALQAEQNFDLTQYAGKRVKRYTYRIINYPSGEEGVQVNLLIHKNTVVGAEVLSSRPDGFLHGLTPQKQVEQPPQ